MKSNSVNNHGNSGDGIDAIKLTNSGSFNNSFNPPIAGTVKEKVRDILSEENGDKVLEKILSGEYRFCSAGAKGRYLDENSGCYVYTFVLDKAGTKQDVDVIFFPNTNLKILIKISFSCYEVVVSKHPHVLNMISGIYPLPVYVRDPYGHTYLLNSKYVH